MRAMISIDKKGATRIVFLTKKYAIKIPSFYSWKMFLHGLIANLNERAFKEYSCTPGSGLCPTVYASETGLISIQKRCLPVQHRGMFWVELAHLACSTVLHEDFFYSDAKPENFGYIDGKLVKLDYGD